MWDGKLSFLSLSSEGRPLPGQLSDVCPCGRGAKNNDAYVSRVNLIWRLPNGVVSIGREERRKQLHRVNWMFSIVSRFRQGFGSLTRDAFVPLRGLISINCPYLREDVPCIIQYFCIKRQLNEQAGYLCIQSAGSTAPGGSTFTSAGTQYSFGGFSFQPSFM